VLSEIAMHHIISVALVAIISLMMPSFVVAADAAHSAHLEAG
jgi:hypothetical protein